MTAADGLPAAVAAGPGGAEGGHPQPPSAAPRVVSSPSGVAHYYRVTFGAARTFCGKPVPQHRGWFGPIDRPATCTRCIRRAGERP